jgi:hydrogenase small subunit
MGHLGCNGWKTYCDCPLRKWNSGGAGQPGVNWCVGSNAPCIGCTQSDFPDGMSPFYTLEGVSTGATGSTGTGTGTGATGSTGTGTGTSTGGDDDRGERDD